MQPITEITHKTDQLYNIMKNYLKIIQDFQQMEGCQQSDPLSLLQGNHRTITCPLQKPISGPFPDNKYEQISEIKYQQIPQTNCQSFATTLTDSKTI